MKKTIIACTMALCAVISAVGYMIAACCCRSSGMSLPYLIEPESKIIMALLVIVAVVSFVIAIKDMKQSTKTEE